MRVAVVQPALSSYHSESVAMTTGLERLLNDRNFNITDSTVGIFTDSHGLCDHLMKLKGKMRQSKFTHSVLLDNSTDSKRCNLNK